MDNCNLYVLLVLKLTTYNIETKMIKDKVHNKLDHLSIVLTQPCLDQA